MSAHSLDPGWVAGVMTLGIVVVGPDEEIRVDLEAPFETRRRLVEELAAGTTAQRLGELAELPPSEAEELLAQLAELGALRAGAAEPRPDLPSIPLAAAVLAAAGDEPFRLAHTSEELLALPAGIDARDARRAVRSFVAGIDPPARRGVYCYLSIWRERSVVGDVPEADRVAAAVERIELLDPAAVHVVDLLRGHVESLAVDELRALDCSRASRLGPILELRDPEPMAAGRLHLASARYGSPNLRTIGTPYEDWARGMAADPELASIMARAEAAERYASGDVSRAPLVRALERDLPGSVPPGDLIAYNERQRELVDWQRPYDADALHHWVPGTAADGSRRWVIADAVYYPFPDPHVNAPPVIAASSNGVAAYTDFPGACERALRELVERDAFMWTWIQRVSRETIDHASLPQEMRDHIATIEREDGLRTALVNLTLDSDPVVLCVLHAEDDLRLGAGCDPDPVTAARKALTEADGIRFSTYLDEDPPASIEEVDRPKDHLLIHLDPEQIERDRFLFGSDERIDVRELRSAEAPLLEAVAAVGEPVFVDITCGASQPFHVVRAIAPGLVPISFGYDREPLGMHRLAEPKRLADGRMVGESLNLDWAGPYIPHPFP
jgi:ribosomal protein S12 methylthiotransferase accessory factor